MPKSFLIGIDAGTTVLKVIAFDLESGEIVASASANLDTDASRQGYAEQSPDNLLTRLAECLDALRELTGDRWTSAAGIGLASQAGSTLLANRTTGQPLSPMLLWSDARGAARMSELQESHPASYWRKHLFRDYPPAGLARLEWLREHHPDLFNGEVIHSGAGELLFHHLTGVWRQDTGHALQITGYDARGRQIPSALIDLAGFQASLFSPLREGHSVIPLDTKAAQRYGLPPGLPVAGPYFDQEAGYLAAAGEGRHPLQCSLGTAWVGNFALPGNDWEGSPFQLVVDGPSDDTLLVVQPLLTGNTAWNWALRFAFGGEGEAAFSKADACFSHVLLPIQRGLMVIPWMSQGNLWLSGEAGSGLAAGIGLETTPEDIVRATAAGMVCELRRTLEDVVASRVVDSLVLSGGAAQGWYFNAMIAALFPETPVFVSVDADAAAARGALFAFGSKVSSVALTPVEQGAVSLREEMAAYYEKYVTIYRNLIGDPPVGRPFRYTR